MKDIKLICWNVASSRFPGTYEFLQKQAGKIDIFCLQEVADTFEPADYPTSLHRTIHRISDHGAQINGPKIAEILNDYTKSFSPHQDFFEEYALEGPFMAIANSAETTLPVSKLEMGAINIFSGEDYATNVVLQWMMIESGTGRRVIRSLKSSNQTKSSRH